jgi:hypothetical protein
MAYRNIIVVIDRLLTIIPSTENVLVKELVDYKKSIWNQAPETLYYKENWIPVGNILQRNITNFDSEWKQIVHKIFINVD